jgi:uncharacterized RDD family membrane protein YckC
MTTAGTRAVDDSQGQGRRLRRLVTPEGLVLDVELAPLGSRLAAFSLDFLFMLAATLLVVLALMALATAVGGQATWMSLAMLAAFFIWNGYFLFFELTRRGVTPGKRINGLKVVSRNGGPLTTGAVFARNLLRELELYLPLQVLIAPELLYGEAPGWALLLACGWIFLFAAMPLFNRDRARCGDLVAGTLVVTRPEVCLLPDAADAQAARRAEERFGFSTDQLDMYGIKELQVLEEILQRDAYDPRRAELLRMVADKIVAKIAFDQPIRGDQVLDFLQAFYRAQRRRLESRLLLGERREHKRIGRLRRK